MKLSIVIPVYNEKNTIRDILARVERSDTGGLQKEIVIVDDASTDGTTEVLREYESQYRVIRHPRNRGKGAALRTGFMAATGDIVLVQDADLEYNPDDYPKLIAPILEGKADAVYGSRFMGGQAHRVLYFWHYVGNKFLTTLSNMFTNLNLTDMETGYKVFRRETIQAIAPKLRSDRFGFEPEVTAKVCKRRLRLY